MNVRSKLKNISIKACRVFHELDNRTDGWLSPFLSIPLMLSFKAATSLETAPERDNRLINLRENELLYGIRKMVYNPAYLLGTEEARRSLLRDFKGDNGNFPLQKMMDYVESDFPKVWGSLLVYGNREQNLDFIAHYAIRKVGDRTDEKALHNALTNLIRNPETFGHKVNSSNQISLSDAYKHVEKINVEREKKIRELAELAVFNHGLGTSMTGYEQVRNEMHAKGQKNWLQRYDITADDVLNYAIYNADNIINSKYDGMEEKTKNSLRKGMATLRAQRDGSSELASVLHHSL